MRTVKTVIIGLIIVILLIIILYLAVVYVLPTLSSSTTKHESTTKEIRLHNIGELATQSAYFTNVQIITGSRDVLGVTMPFTQSRYIYSYDGIVKAGVDFENVSASIDDENKTIAVTMPEPQIFDVTVDEDSLVVYDETKSVFNPLKLNDIKESMLVLKEEARENAINHGILTNAKTNAEAIITGFIRTMYSFEYSIVFQ